MNNFIRNMSITRKLAFLLTLPVLLLIWLLAEQFITNIQHVRTAQHLTSAIKISAELDKLIGTLQAERGASGVFVDSQGKRFTNRLPQIRQNTDNQITAFKNLNQHSINLQQQFSQLSQLRQQADSFSISGNTTTERYTAIITEMIAFNYQLEAQIEHQAMARQVAVINQFIDMKERAGRERAILALAFSQDSFTTELFTRFTTNLGAYRTYEENMVRMLQPAVIPAWQNTLTNNHFTEVERIRQLAQSTGTGQPLGINDENWFDLASQKLAVMTEFEQNLLNQLSTDTAKVYQQAMSRLWLISALVVIAVIILCWLTAAIIRSISFAVQDIDNTIIRLSQRDLTARTQYRSQDEFGRIASGTNKMASELQQVLTEIGSATAQVASAAEESSVVTRQASQTIQQQKQDAELVATAMHEMTTTVRDVAGSTAEAADLSESVQNSASDGQQKLKKTIELIKRLSGQVEKTSTVIDKVKHDSDAISSVLDVIRGIADQTNLLALNAAIEAARAGEHGRGFAVVADEVRTLAQRTTQSTGDIQKMIEGLQQGSSQATEAMQQSFRQAAESNEQVTETGSILTILLEGISGINDKNIQIASAAEEQSTVADDINHKMVSISDSLVQASAGAEQTAVTSRELARLAEELESLIGRFKLT